MSSVDVSSEKQCRDPDLLWGARARVLIVDDDPIQLQIAGATLGGHEYDVTTAADGWEGLRLLKEQDYSLVVVDLDMPRLDGFGFIAEARKLPKCTNLPIIVVSGRQDVVSIDRAFAAGADSFMDKPVNWNLFGRHVRYVLRSAETAENMRRLAKEAQDDKAVGAHLFESMVKRVRKWAQQILIGQTRIREVIEGKQPPEELPRAIREIDELISGSVPELEKRIFDQQVLAGSVRPFWVDVEPQRIWEEVGKVLAGRARQSGVELHILPTDAFAASVTLQCDPQLVRAALSKLVQNAIAAAPQGSRVVLISEDGNQGEFVLGVEDRGPGFTKAQAESLFIPDHMRTAGRGGVGLLVVNRIARLHDARLTYRTPREGGTRAEFIFPRHKVTRNHAE